MPCTTILVGKHASYDGSTMMARNEDSQSGVFTAKKFLVINPEDQPRHYKSVISKVEMDLPDFPLRYTSMPDAIPKDGIWGEAGINECNVAMTETETITSNPRVLGADPLVKGGIGEEDLLTIVLPYIHSAREGVTRLGSLLEQFGTYEMNGIGFQDVNEIWWFESIGGHHWIARRVPDDAYVVMPNQQGIDFFDFTDAFGEQKENMCSADLLDFITKNHLDLTAHEEGYSLAQETEFDVRGAFGSRDDSDHTYNTPRAWFMLRYFNPNTFLWDGPDADFTPESDFLPWCLVPERLVTVEDVKYVLSGHYQGTTYDPYNNHAPVPSLKGKYRPIGINRNNFVALTQLRPYVPAEIQAVEWIACGSNVYNAFVPFYANVESAPDYLSRTGKEVKTNNFYWANRLIAALSDPHFNACSSHIERYQNTMHAAGHRFLNEFDAKFEKEQPHNVHKYLKSCNKEIAEFAQKETSDLLSKVLYEASCGMKNAFSRSDA
jgi:dipeptidase